MFSQLQLIDSRRTLGESDILMPEMPVMNELHQALGEVHPSVAGFLGLQHLFGSTASLVHRIALNRINPENVFLLGKPYSTNPSVADLLQNELGYWVHPDSVDQPSELENDSQMDHRIGQTLDRISAVMQRPGIHSPKRILLIDDGGRAIKLLHSERYDAIRRNFTCVEQTRCGTRAIADLDLEVPVINVAESWVKLEHESPLIAASVIRELSNKLEGLRQAGIPVEKKILIIGYGAIGQAVAHEFLKSGQYVAIYDNQPTRLIQAANDGFRIIHDFGTALRRGGVIVGCTGLPVLDHANYRDIADGSLLISASSADVEFRAWNLRAHGECLGDPARWNEGGRPGDLRAPDSEGRRWDHPCFSLYRINGQDRSFYLVNGGFPVNFTGGVDPIKPADIQLTRSLLFAGAVQASHTTKRGLHDLDHFSQNILMDALQATRSMQVAQEETDAEPND